MSPNRPRRGAGGSSQFNLSDLMARIRAIQDLPSLLRRLKQEQRSIIQSGDPNIERSSMSRLFSGEGDVASYLKYFSLGVPGRAAFSPMQAKFGDLGAATSFLEKHQGSRRGFLGALGIGDAANKEREGIERKVIDRERRLSDSFDDLTGASGDLRSVLGALSKFDVLGALHRGSSAFQSIRGLAQGFSSRAASEGYLRSTLSSAEYAAVSSGRASLLPGIAAGAGAAGAAAPVSLGAMLGYGSMAAGAALGGFSLYQLNKFGEQGVNNLRNQLLGVVGTTQPVGQFGKFGGRFFTDQALQNFQIGYASSLGRGGLGTVESATRDVVKNEKLLAAMGFTSDNLDELGKISAEVSAGFGRVIRTSDLIDAKFEKSASPVVRSEFLRGMSTLSPQLQQMYMGRTTPKGMEEELFGLIKRGHFGGQAAAGMVANVASQSLSAIDDPQQFNLIAQMSGLSQDRVRYLLAYDPAGMLKALRSGIKTRAGQKAVRELTAAPGLREGTMEQRTTFALRELAARAPLLRTAYAELDKEKAAPNITNILSTLEELPAFKTAVKEAALASKEFHESLTAGASLIHSTVTEIKSQLVNATHDISAFLGNPSSYIHSLMQPSPVVMAINKEKGRNNSSIINPHSPRRHR